MPAESVSGRLRSRGIWLALFNTIVAAIAIAITQVWDLDILWVVGAPLASGLVSLSVAALPGSRGTGSVAGGPAPRPSAPYESQGPLAGA